MITNPQLAREVAQALLQIEAVSLRPDDPFTWASGLRAPIYCDNRVTLAVPQVRSLIEHGLAQLAGSEFGQVDVIAGTATAGIAHAALVAEIAGLPMAYVRSAAKDHGRGKQIEGRITPGQRVVMVEDLISTGGSVLAAARAVEAAGATVLGVIAIFNYGMQRGVDAFASYREGGLPLYTLSNFPTLVEVAAARGDISADQQAGLANWSADPQAWSQRWLDANKPA